MLALPEYAVCTGAGIEGLKIENFSKLLYAIRLPAAAWDGVCFNCFYQIRFTFCRSTKPSFLCLPCSTPPAF